MKEFDISGAFRGLGSDYGLFMSYLSTSPTKIMQHVIKQSLQFIGCDENMLANVLCTCTSEKLNELVEACGDKSGSLMNQIVKKTVQGSPIQKFFLHLLETDRPISVSRELAGTQAQHLIKCGLYPGSAIKLDSEIFATLLHCSREQCQFINEEYQRACNTSLRNVILSTYKGSISRALVLWTSLPEFAISKVLQMTLLSNSELRISHICAFIARSDKHVLRAVNRCYQEMFGKPLADVLSSCLNGNLRVAIRQWICDLSYDNGCEGQIAYHIKAYSKDNGLILDSDLGDAVLALLQEEGDCIGRYAAKHNMDIESIKQQDVKAKRDGHSISKKKHSEKGVSGEVVATEDDEVVPRKSEGHCKSQQREMIDRMKNFLQETFYEDDMDNSGYLDHAEFGRVMIGLNVGFTRDDVLYMVDMIDCDKDGKIAYEEVTTELAKYVLHVIKHRYKDISVQQKMCEMEEVAHARHVQMYEDHQKTAAALASSLPLPLNGTSTDPSSVAVPASSQACAIVPDLKTYLYDTFSAHDQDSSGTLNASEFWGVISGVLNLTEGDESNLLVWYSMV